MKHHFLDNHPEYERRRSNWRQRWSKLDWITALITFAVILAVYLPDVLTQLLGFRMN